MTNGTLGHRVFIYLFWNLHFSLSYDGVCCSWGHSWWASSISGDIKQSSGRVLPSLGGTLRCAVGYYAGNSAVTEPPPSPWPSPRFPFMMSNKFYMLQFASSTNLILFELRASSVAFNNANFAFSNQIIHKGCSWVCQKRGRAMKIWTVQIYWSIQKMRLLGCWTCQLHDILRWKRTRIDTHCYLGWIDCVRLGLFKKVMHIP